MIVGPFLLHVVGIVLELSYVKDTLFCPTTFAKVVSFVGTFLGVLCDNPRNIQCSLATTIRLDAY